ncbi:MAG: hypothetical protein V7L21_08900 [Nostoc sp.]|uniref:hypothetical protein n=1 Tax=unclassified Nostoc TaxID=2593658 RepID=UPI0025E8928B|nr:hypothetical protein [Nostoc sp. NMS9]MBN3940698.1 hypothetical protein [Nostoc sp. NMS9]
MPPLIPPMQSYGVHTSREIPLDAWFRPLALGCWIVPGSPSLRTRVRLVERRNDERKCVSQTSNRKNYGIMRLLSEARNDNFIGSRKLETLADTTCVYTVADALGGKSGSPPRHRGS